MKSLIFWGASGQAKVLRELVGTNYHLVAVFDNEVGLKAPFDDVPIFYTKEAFVRWRESTSDPIFGAVAIGGARGLVRIELQIFLESNNVTIETLIHPTAFVAARAIGGGCQILANASVCIDSQLGMGTIINTGAIVDHESVLGMGVHIAPGASLAGCVEIGDYSMVGTGATILPRVKIGRNTIVGAGAVVTKNLPDNVIAYGNPAQVIRTNI